MATPNESSELLFRRTTPPGASQYEVFRVGQHIGRVGRFRMGAAQFGSTWMATTPSGRNSTRFPTRESAAAWLVEQARN